MSESATQPTSKLAMLLLEVGAINESQLRHASRIQAKLRPPRPLLSIQLGHPLIDPSKETLDRELVLRAPAEWCRRYGFLPIRHEADQVLVAFVDPLNTESRQAAEKLFGASGIAVALAPPSALEAAWAKLTSGRERPEETVLDVVKIVDEAIAEAVARDASDIHIEPMADSLRIRFREDGVLLEYRTLPAATAATLVNRIKVLCNADIAERRRHQDGRFVYERDGLEVDLRVSFYVTIHGEKVVLRLLNRDRPLLPIEEIGIPPAVLRRFKEDALYRPSGVILVTGPTGSGKTSTLYSAIHHINSPDISIVTAEDPVEYQIDGIAQCSLDPDIDRTYEETLRHIVRQDPDVIVIGEIRDQFSAETAIQAALTGHKVITTFHTEDTIGGLIRLLHMNVEAFLISSTVVCVIAQRLLRRVCAACSASYTPTAVDLRRLGYVEDDLAGATLKMGRGCGECRRTGYRGRVAVFELLLLGDELREAIIAHRPSQEIRRISRERGGMVSLLEDGIVKAASGQTTLEEVLRVLPRLDPARPLAELRRMVGE